MIFLKFYQNFYQNFILPKLSQKLPNFTKSKLIYQIWSHWLRCPNEVFIQKLFVFALVVHSSKPPTCCLAHAPGSCSTVVLCQILKCLFSLKNSYLEKELENVRGQLTSAKRSKENRATWRRSSDAKVEVPLLILVYQRLSVVASELYVNWNDNSYDEGLWFAEAKIVFLSFELKYMIDISVSKLPIRPYLPTS